MYMMNVAILLQAHRSREEALLAHERRDHGIQGAAWFLTIFIVGGIHAGIAWYLLREQPQAVAPPVEAGAVMIDLAPEIQQATSQKDAAVAKPEEEAVAAREVPSPEEEEKPKPPLEKVEEAPVPAIAPLTPTPKGKPEKEKPRKTVAKPVRKPPPKPKTPQKPSQAAAVRTASAPRSEQRASITSAMSSGASSEAAIADWKNQVSAILQRNKRFPAGVQASGSPALRVSIAASGQVSGVSIVISSGSPELDRAAMETAYRSSPLPPPPSGAISLTFRMNFRIR